MNRLKKLNKRKFIFAITLLILFFIALFLLFKKDNDLNEAIHDEKYDLIINYNKTDVKKVDNPVKKYIRVNKRAFLNNIKNKEKDTKYNLLINVNTKKYDDFYFVHASNYQYLGGAHYNRDDYGFTYNTKTNKYIDITHFFKDKDSFEKLFIVAKNNLEKYAKKEGIVLDNEIVKDGLHPNLENYKYFYFDDNGLSILLLPLQVASWSDGEILITLPWEDINTLLKSEYQNKNVTKEKEILVPKTRDIEKLQNKKVIAFTFDDGPNKKTTEYLINEVEKMDARVTFFVLGSRISYNEDTIKKAFINGNEIGSHTYSHRNLVKLTDDEVKDEINKTNHIIESVIGVEPKLLRAPYGSINDKIVSYSNMSIINWSIDSNDWRLKNRDLIKKEILNYAADGKVVLVHDIYEESVHGAILAMKELEKQGYEFVTISEMAQLKEQTLETGVIYREF